MKKIGIIGGGAAGLACAVFLARKSRFSVTVFERSPRVGRKLSATGNGQGNVTNTDMGAAHYFSDDIGKTGRILARFGDRDTVRFLESMGGVFLPDARGRVYPAGRQASAITDLFRTEAARLGVRLHTESMVKSVAYRSGMFEICEEKFDAAVLCTGGMAAPNFGSDGSGYELARAFGHTVTECRPALVQLRCNTDSVRGLKGIRMDGNVRLLRGGREVKAFRGDVLFTDTGVSGDAVFRISSFAEKGDRLEIDLLPDVSEERLLSAFGKRKEEPYLCILPNGLGRAIEKRAGGDVPRMAGLVKRFPLAVEGTAGFSAAQVTKGGIPLRETDEYLMSDRREGLYFAGEILNVDGECGGYNLQWAFSSAYTVSEGLCR